jgi:hypothetical protein
MQTVIHVFCTPGPSLREEIKRDRELYLHMLQVTKRQKQGRAPGWMKLHSTAVDRRGALNIQWDPAGATLRCRVVNRGAGKPNLIVGDFLDYMLDRFHDRVRVVTILPG